MLNIHEKERGKKNTHTQNEDKNKIHSKKKKNVSIPLL